MKKFYSKIIDFIFYNESEIRKAVVESRIDITRPELKNGSGISDPTARDAIRNLMPISQITICGQVIKFPERWLIVVEKTYLCASVNRKHIFKQFTGIISAIIIVKFALTCPYLRKLFITC